MSLSVQDSSAYRNLVKLFHSLHRSEVLELFLSFLQQKIYSGIPSQCLDARMHVHSVTPTRVGPPYTPSEQLEFTVPLFCFI